MNIADVGRLYAYTEWANARIIATIRELSDEQLDRHIDSSFPSIRKTLAHIVSAEWVWLTRWKGESPGAMPAWAVDAPLDSLVANLTRVESERRELFDSMTDDDLEKTLSYRTLKGDPFSNRFADLCTHVANHSTYHRGQLTTMIRQVGATPPSTDFSVFVRL